MQDAYDQLNTTIKQVEDWLRKREEELAWEEKELIDLREHSL